MKKLFSLILVVALVLPVFIFAGDVPSAEAQSGRQVWAFYMGWWTADAWGQRASVLIDHPAAGNYDSRDGGIAASQIEQAQSAGIDAFIVSWFGVSDQFTTTPTLNNMLDRAAERGFHVAAAVDVFDADFNRSRQAMVGSLNYLVSDRANHPGYLRYNGKPVIYFAFQERSNFSNTDWAAIRNAVDPGRVTHWVAEGLSGCCIHGGVFDGMYAFNTAWSRNPTSTAAQQFNATRSAGGAFYSPTVHPGWNEDVIAAQQGRTNPTAAQDRAGGAFLTNSWNGAVASGADVILIVSWNEFIENSHIEPSQTYGTQSLDILRPLIAAWKAGVPAPPVAGTGTTTGTTTTTTTTAPVAPLTGLIATIDIRQLNVRAGATTSAARIGQVRFGEQYQLIGRNADNSWWLIAMAGGQGWISASFARFEGGDPLSLPVTDAVGNVTAAQPTTLGGTSAVPATGVILTAINNLNMRGGPGTNFARVSRIPWQAEADVLGRNADNSWFLIRYNGVDGWVAGEYVVVTGNLAVVPVSG